MDDFYFVMEILLILKLSNSQTLQPNKELFPAIHFIFFVTAPLRSAATKKDAISMVSLQIEKNRYRLVKKINLKEKQQDKERRFVDTKISPLIL
ncbi:hypothetical protein ABEG63_16895, partial [Chryseobacterium sp. C39-AII1]|uniref:hypothetical protein n=2 Tax=Chryseobacterium TaxID=59732 RepID=UPI003208B46A